MNETILPRIDIVERLRDLHVQATQERTHYYTGACIQDAMLELEATREAVKSLIRAIEAEGYHVMISMAGPRLSLERSDKLKAIYEDAAAYRGLCK
jgi:hypothetical protein